ncbi:MAG: UDP-N-acetylmuramate dehydrogenase [Mycobacteriales bacterium]
MPTRGRAALSTRTPSPAPTALAELTTLRLGGPVGRLVTATTRGELVDAVRTADRAGSPVLLVGGGSNLVASDEGWPGTVVLVRSGGVDRRDSGDRVALEVQAGAGWDELVDATVHEGLAGLETMAGIPGLVGATPVQNVGAYGTEVADVITAVGVLDRRTGAVEQWTPPQCRFGARTSAFKHTDRYVVLDVSLALSRRAEGGPLHHAELARRLGVEPGATAPLARVREAVLELRRGKGMVLDPADHDTWSVGSFFVNPVVGRDQVPPGCPRWEVDDGVKLSAAWLIENAGFPKGFCTAPGTVAVSGKHCLALTNRGGGTTAQLLALAGRIRAGVQERYGVRLRPEPRLAGVALP